MNIGHRLKLTAAEVLCSAAAGRVYAVFHGHKVVHHGVAFDTHDARFRPGVEASLLWGVYEGAETRFIRAHLAGEEHVVELGASLGVTGSHTLTVMDPDGTYLAVEAN